MVSRVASQLEEKYPGSSTDHRIFGGSVQLPFNESFSHSGQMAQNSISFDTIFDPTGGPSQILVPNFGFTDLYTGIYTFGPISTSPPTVSSQFSLATSQKKSFLPHTNHRRVQDRPQMVARPQKCVARGTLDPPSPRVDLDLGRQPGWLGGPHGVPLSERGVVPTGKEISHKLEGTQKHSFGNPIFPITHFKQVTTHQVRQHSSPGLFGTQRRDKVLDPVCSSKGNFVTSTQFKHSNHGTTYFRSSQHLGRHFVTSQATSGHRVESSPISSSGNLSDLGHPTNRPVCHKIQFQTPNLLFDPARPSSLCYRQSKLSLDKHGRLCLSTTPDHTFGTQQDRESTLSGISNLPSVAQSPMVHQIVRSHDSCSTQTTSFSQTFETAPDPPNVPSKSRTFKSSRLEIIKYHISQRGFSKKAVQRITHRHRVSTGAQYEAKWQQYLHWCHQRDAHPLEPSELLIADFFIFLFEEKKFCPATVIGYRTMLTQTFKFFPEISFDCLNNCYLQAILQNLKITCPATRFKTPQWDLAVVLRALMKPPFEPIVSIPFDLLTYKTAFLLTLASGARASEIHALSFHSFSRDRNWTHVWLSPSDTFLAKNQTSRAPGERRHFRVPALTNISDDTSARYLCPVRALRIYMAKTHNRRKGKKLLFLAISPKYQKDITKNTLTNYIKQAIIRAYKVSTEQDISLSKCSIHEIRALSASIAFKYNVSLDKIMQNCTWKSDLIFTNYYLRDLALHTADLYRLPGFVCAGQKLKNKLSH